MAVIRKCNLQKFHNQIVTKTTMKMIVLMTDLGWIWSSFNAQHIRLQRSLRSVTAASEGPADSRQCKRKHSEGVPPIRALGDSFRVVLSIHCLSVGTAHPRLSSGDASSVILSPPSGVQNAHTSYAGKGVQPINYPSLCFSKCSYVLCRGFVTLHLIHFLEKLFRE